MRVALGFPYWGDDPVRESNFLHVLDRVSGLYPFDFVYNIGGNWTRGSARNRIVDVAKDYDVVVICDADTFPEPEPLRVAIEAAYSLGGLHFPFNQFRGLNHDGTVALKTGLTGWDRLLDMECLGSMGGVIVIRPDQWWEAGGSPEMDGWGFEDVMFAVQARTLLRVNTWHPGWITHLWHGTECVVGSEAYLRNIKVCKEVEALDGDESGIRRYIAESELYP